MLIGGNEVTPRSLTLPEFRKVRALVGDAADIQMVAWSCGVDLEVVEDWFGNAPMRESMAVLAAVVDACGLSEGAIKSEPAADDVGDARQTV